ncbi:hypothetical protein QMK17_24975 [Rhodococcus sp. G-MC3]|uniref:hypothetical protein n=1 Tax=Rhodococcus sp. G-MC3 TaxID=3046209 RepID=UPI0024B89EB9|nr:hypothetical protein [Rhodococcus sp. G-MC3]MDJ0396559.1 hypothetical protein [Rhodococcus sp. G-MC3]
MSGDRTHLRLVGDAAVNHAAPTIDVAGGARMVTVHVQNVGPGQVCEILHNGVFSISHRVVVADNETSVTIISFALRRGNYEVSLRVDGELVPTTGTQTVFVGPQAGDRLAKSSCGMPRSRHPRSTTQSVNARSAIPLHS